MIRGRSQETSTISARPLQDLVRCAITLAVESWEVCPASRGQAKRPTGRHHQEPKEKLMNLSRLGALALLAFPAAASAVMTIDDIRWPQTGAYPAYPEELSAAATGRRLHAYVYGGLYHDSNL